MVCARNSGFFGFCFNFAYLLPFRNVHQTEIHVWVFLWLQLGLPETIFVSLNKLFNMQIRVDKVFKVQALEVMLLLEFTTNHALQFFLTLLDLPISEARDDPCLFSLERQDKLRFGIQLFVSEDGLPSYFFIPIVFYVHTQLLPILEIKLKHLLLEGLDQTGGAIIIHFDHDVLPVV